MSAPSSPSQPSLVWFRDDLRLSDNPALAAAVRSGRPVLCVFIHDPKPRDTRPPGGAARWWLAGSLRALDASLRGRGGRLDIFEGDPEQVLPRLVAEAGVRLVTWNRRYGEAEREMDGRLKAGLARAGVEAESFNGHLLNEPWEVKSTQGGPIRVFSPYWRAALARGPVAKPILAPARIVAASLPAGMMPAPCTVDALRLEPTAPDWAGGLREAWTPGETGAQARLGRFVEEALAAYADNRNRPDLPATSRLSPHLRFGEVSARQCWSAATLASEVSGRGGSGLAKFQSELGWREFSYHLLFHYPRLAWENYNPRFDDFPFREDPAGLAAWRRGRTGYPIVDAGLRELWTTGWMHNRVRMIAASFLTKHLLVDWRRGEEWFWDTLADADPANNAASWQWVAGSGADAAPYFRIFNPILQGERFDPHGDYVRRWAPELARLPAALIHRPWSASALDLAAAGVRLGHDYPLPIVEHDAARRRALAAFERTKPVGE